MVTYEHVPGDLRLEADLDNPAAQIAVGSMSQSHCTPTVVYSNVLAHSLGSCNYATQIVVCRLVVLALLEACQKCRILHSTQTY